jgi:hypothetical protein
MFVKASLYFKKNKIENTDFSPDGMASFSFFFKKERYSEQQEIAPEKA